ncbi:MAG: PIN domain-containing protein [Tildeniella nuda ZEHNDER 1965/U140]|jgi:predicted nucleic acid-binding protein|nr:PIN domain-containing protein [Tildeniella nuda ZEHNDER 1965/U140]
MSNKPYFLDSNVWLYRLLDNQSLEAQERERKRTIAFSLTAAQDIITSTQVINEVCANAFRKAAFTEAQIQTLIESFQSRCTVVALNIETLTIASSLRSRYCFSFWDGLIVASALSANAEILYSEDMQDGLVVEQQLTIVNPFK